MTTYYYVTDNENNIILSDTDKTRLQNTLNFKPEYKDNEILETENIIYNNQIVSEDEYQTILNEEERQRLDSLSLTRADVERAIYKSKGMDFDDIIATVETMNEAGTTDIDIKALKIELKANNFYRGNEYVNQIGNLLGYSSDDLDYLFENGGLPESEYCNNE